MREAISVIGLGYIGLPLAMCLCEQGHRVIGIDVDPVKLRDLSAGRTQVMESYEGEPLASILQRHLASGRFVPTGDWAMAAEASSHIITVGIPVHENGVPDPLPLLAAIRSLGAVLRQGDLVLVRSTLVPGMMEQDIIPLLAETSRMVPGTDFAVAYAAERVAEGRAMYEFRTLDVVVGGLTPACGERAKALLSTLTDGQVHLTDLRTAQLTKVIENVQRDVNIALAHQIKEIAEHHGVDVYELIRLANTHPRVRLLEPGLGVGGYCIPNAYAYIAASLPKTRPVPLLTLARRINEEAPIRAAAQLERQLAALGKRLRESTVAILGLGMKDGSNDTDSAPRRSLVNWKSE
ncbi:NDP-sugar dehydrogenase [Alicyclobacillus cellulosilyticus]|uniref:NDP-sugar dehydrogenase n=1 Tax=Alicyclobacillus cellulosilyticus TaxID=1003997 RepID=A0A917KEI0_9BACL|nr:nucleotide sugar dehydrogenase [Alicyclobacillus cellulosilyticus]GGJ09420.1 NDP-sugar dehydrogenase [Alicyclobacillus cellulosilyticus]